MTMRKRIGRGVACGLVMLFLLGAGFQFFSARDLSRPGYIALGILLTAATLWLTEAVPLFVTSLLILLLSIVWLAPEMRSAGMAVDDAAFLAPFFSDIILLFLGGFVMSTALRKLLLDEWLARQIVARTGRSVPKLIAGVMMITAVLSMWLSNTATAAMMLGLVLPIARSMPADDRYRKALLLSIPFAANVGGLGTPIGSPPNAIAMQYMRQLEIDPSFGMWMLIGVPGVVGMLALTWVLLMFFYRGTAGVVLEDNGSLRIKRSPAMYLVVGTTLVTMMGWLTGGLHGFSSGTVALIPVLVFFGNGVLTRTDLRSLSWDVLLLMGGGLCLGVVMARSGLADWLVAGLPIEGLNAYWVMVLFGGVACVMSCVMSNTATANLMMPIILGMSIEPLSPVLIGIAFACSMAMPLPVSTPPNAMAFSSGEITAGPMFKTGLCITIVGLVLTFSTGYWWWGIVGLY